ncbi:lytic transglycosylase domain-containing protein [Mucilaginibacter sp. FT3.2]|uniref:lytic transglycosylase domain-containing protein n=1 Tax=Mucilaginibacter sp. FT3.2 TaxID=2723090 RepID=UPI00160F98C7|nr:lytic transglycosylase domain-containing protein [Mucilaginibacter sp. FT3.2]MBB6234455.1 membrane-bound lytic murein transglycosylase D [Mucilaginibacter sp. FT3.2]
MKRLFTLTICLSLLQIISVNARPMQKQISGFANFHGGFKPDTIITSIAKRPIGMQGNIYERRLDSVHKDIQLDYNEYVQSYIDLYMRNRDEMGQVAGLTKYYFPIYEKAFRDAGIPEEIKFLSIVESKLDPNAISRVGATGPWQFMATTAKVYGLSMNDYVDERRDPIQASYAAAAYLKDAYQEFGDWLLAIASYNCGKSNVEHAMEKAGAGSDFWAIRQYLPAETRGYVPAFIAMNYVMNYFGKHNIVAQACSFSLKTDTVMVKKFVSLSNVARALNVGIAEITILNPAYRKLIVNGTPHAPRRLILPQTSKENFAALYNVLNSAGDAVAPMEFAKPAPVYAAAPVIRSTYAETGKAERKITTYHKVKKGETLAGIADLFGCEVHDLKIWNNLESNRAPVGRTLRVAAGGDISASVSAESKPTL